ncbi:MAG: 4-hydroxythreonine-4-phosphate dehydrogenase PdxA [Proteobacteria bacterium]|nr:MAG: 4-hydroxythreonine-4-phosphate dehydrogenase PdxA [Pseudomonadota bacterium]
MPPVASIAFTPGEPAGIGPDLCAHLLDHPLRPHLVAIADPELIRERTRALGRAVEPVAADTPATAVPANGLRVEAVALAVASTPGKLDTRNSGYVLDALRLAAAGCQTGRYAALVTGPVHKGIINEAGIAFSGHTEFLAERVGGHPVMMLACPGLRVALATTHLSLHAVAAAITPTTLETVIRILDRDLRQRFGIARPRIVVCGLNPHAGEGGHLGREEVEVIGPVLQRLTAEGMVLQGPVPADTVFTPPCLARTDVVLAMYHDQGLPVLKHLGFGRSVNITLGLPIIRTSVDHGTALDLAGSGNADSGSLFAAIDTAFELARVSAR